MEAPTFGPSISRYAIQTSEPPPNYDRLRDLIWIYFWLLIFEGALRKWVLPGLSNPLLIVRDPIAILIYLWAMTKGVFPKNPFVLIIIILGLATFFISLVVNSSHFLVTVYGFRSNFLHLIVIFVVQELFSVGQVKRIGFWVLVISIPMAVLIFAQFASAPDSVVNEGFAHTSVQLDSAMGKIRPPGTFSFTSGCAEYLTLAAAFLLYALIEKGVYPGWLLYLAAPSLVLSVALSGSRTSLSAMTVLFAGVAGICLFKPQFFKGSVNVVLTLAIGYLVVGSWSIFSQGVAVLNYRVGDAANVRTGIVDRYFSGFVAPFEAVSRAPLLGDGLGLGTMGGAALIGGKRDFLLAEDELSRIVLESGPIFGFAYILLRIAIIVYAGGVAFGALNKGNPLPVLLFLGFAPLMLNGQFGQPTTLGFAVFGAGLCLAAAKEEAGSPDASAGAVQPEVIGRRGRSPYAERLHSGSIV